MVCVRFPLVQAIIRSRRANMCLAPGIAEIPGDLLKVLKVLRSRPCHF